MSQVAKLIDLVVQGKNTEATEVLNQELMSRSYAGINEIKPDVAAEYFSPVTNYQSDEESFDEPEPEEPTYEEEDE